MIARLYRDDPLVRSLPVSVPVLALFLGVLFGQLTGAFQAFDELDAARDATPAVGTWLSTMLVAQNLLIGVTFGMMWLQRVDGVGWAARGRALDVGLPVPARSSWWARLLANGTACLVPLLVGAAVLVGVGLPVGDVLWLSARLAAAALGALGLRFALSPARRVPTGWRHTLASIGLCALVLFAYIHDGSPSWAGPPVLCVALLGAGATAVAWADRRLPLSWSAGSAFDGASSTPSGRTGVGHAATRPAWGAGLRVMAASIWDHRAWTALLLPMVFLLIPGLSVALMGIPLAMLAVIMVHDRARFVGALPVPSSRVLLVGLAPVLLGLAGGLVLSEAWAAWRHPMRPVVVIDKQIERLEPAADGGPQFRGWIDVTVPSRHWNIAWDGEPAVQVAPSGEAVRPRAMPLLGLPGPVVYNPFDAPHGSSLAFTAWQCARAIEAEHGVWIEPEVLAERYLELNYRGDVDIAGDYIGRKLEWKDQTDRWYAGVATLHEDFPQLEERRRPTEALVGVLVLLVGSALGGVLMLRASRNRLWAVGVRLLPALLIMFAIPGHQIWGLTGWGGPAKLLAIAGRVAAERVPVALLVALVLAGAWWSLRRVARALDRAERLPPPSPAGTRR